MIFLFFFLLSSSEAPSGVLFWAPQYERDVDMLKEFSKGDEGATASHMTLV